MDLVARGGGWGAATGWQNKRGGWRDRWWQKPGSRLVVVAQQQPLLAADARVEDEQEKERPKIC